MNEPSPSVAATTAAPSIWSLVQSVVKQVVDLGEQIFRLFRDFALGALFFLLMIFPKDLNRRLRDAGFTKVNAGGVVWEKQVEAANEQTKAAAATVAGTSQALSDVNDKLAQVAQNSSDPKVKSAIQQSIQQLNGTLGEVKKADHSLQETVLTQQDLLAQSTTTPASRQEGWLYVGEVAENKQTWADGSPKNMLPAPLPLGTGQSITVSGLNYLRGDSASQQHKDASVASVVRDRTKLKIESIDYSHARAGGWFIWLKVVTE